MKKLLLSVIILVNAVQTHGQVLESTDENYITKTTETFSQSIRSNPKQFFLFLNRFTQEHPQLEKYLAYKGWISGDSHPGQWSFVPNENKFIYTMIDFDMAGKGPFILDFIQYALNVKAIIHQSPSSKDNKIKIRDMLAAYLSGLDLEDSIEPKWILKVLEKDSQQFLKAEQNYYLKKVDENDKLEVEKGFQRLSDASKEAQIRYVLSKQNYFDHYGLLDIVQKKIERGGSAGQERYWILVEDKKSERKQIFELKEKQKGILPHTENTTQKMYQVYWKQPHPAYFEIKIEDKTFEVRPKKIAINKTDIPYNLKTDEQWDYLHEKAIYDLHLMGSSQAPQKGASELAKLMRSNFEEIIDLSKKFIEKYIQEKDQ